MKIMGIQIGVGIVGLDWLVHEAFDVEMHFGACAGNTCCIFGPKGFDLLWGHGIIFVIGIPIFAYHHFFDNVVGVEMFKMAVIPCGDGCVGGIGVGGDGVFVGRLVE
jgi:hypothetical protein